MKICVLIKQVPSTDSPLSLNEDGTWVREENITFTTNESDAYALEEALRIKENTGESEVVVASLGPDRTQRAIREALSKGADRGIHIQESFPYTSDPFVVASLLGSALKEEQFDLIFSGLQSDDLGMGQTGVILGELLGMSTATLAVALEVGSSSVRVKRELESGWFQWVTMNLPASVTIQSGINTPRYPSLKGIMGARKKEIRTVNKLALEGPDEELQSFKNVYLPKKTKRTEMLEGELDQVVLRLVDVLKRNVKVL